LEDNTVRDDDHKLGEEKTNLGGDVEPDFEYVDPDALLSKIDTDQYWKMKLFPDTTDPDTLPEPTSTKEDLLELASTIGIPSAFLSHNYTSYSIPNRCTNLEGLHEGIGKKQSSPQPSTVLPDYTARSNASAIEIKDHLTNALRDSNFHAPVSLIQHAESLEVDINDKTKASILRYASINDVSRAFRLNQPQHLAFSIIASGLLWSFVYARQENVNDKARSEHQRLLCLHGLGGSGKSTVIRAWIALAQCWFEPEAVFTFAKTGNF
jgi:hypothetical protein